MKRIDAHLHVAEVVAGYCRRGELRAIGAGKVMWGNGEVFQLFPEEYGDTNFTIEAALSLMKAEGVAKAVLMQGSMYGFQNQYHAKILKKYADVFCPSCTVDPYMSNHLETLQMYLTQQNFRLVKFEVSSGGGLMGCHEPFSLVSKRMMKIYDLIEARGAILALDVGDLTMESHQPEALLEIAKTHPKMKLVICHLLAPVIGREKEWEQSIHLLNKQNICFDLAALPKILNEKVYPYPEVANFLRKAKDMLGTKKLLWGTDAPFAITKDSYGRLKTYIEDSDIFSKEELEDIYYNNANQLYFQK
jgi:Predicted metal-dependent hydrolase of the TIM-barrel fold